MFYRLYRGVAKYIIAKYKIAVTQIMKSYYSGNTFS